MGKTEGDIQKRTGRAGKAEQDRQTGQAELGNRHNFTDRMDRQKRTDGTGQAEQQRQNMTGRKGQAEQNRQNKTGRTGQE
jgi:hypothetical protein